MTNDITPAAAAPPAPTAAQAVTVVQPAERPLSLDIGHVGAWAGAIIAITTVAALLYKLLTREMSRDIREVAHKVRNVVTRVDSIEHLRTGDIERIVKLEAAQTSFDRAVERVERGQEKLADTINDRFDLLAESIREIRSVSPRG
ncbi:hypothetical protein [Sphingomonas profundi]|uniref:hypothetical protein n=1 Tax=Alterirhizorhabdus profundi TaxID=2681549 RepID=UPI0012E80488|nr:hypothetical protein [Sphingomonas profundi]